MKGFSSSFFSQARAGSGQVPCRRLPLLLFGRPHKWLRHFRFRRVKLLFGPSPRQFDKDKNEKGPSSPQPAHSFL